MTDFPSQAGTGFGLSFTWISNAPCRALLRVKANEKACAGQHQMMRSFVREHRNVRNPNRGLFTPHPGHVRRLPSHDPVIGCGLATRLALNAQCRQRLGEWPYVLNNGAAQYLAADQTITESFPVTINGGHGPTDSQTVTVTITGTNDAATVAFEAKSVTEGNAAAALNTTGQLSITDPDAGEAHVVAQSNAHGS
ncbi:VCBS domain-containing protein [Bradyrhizobium sp. CIR3A]|uniref:VCBS domain-containing protein n=1 Tax=Bradyrhizobium sp. CIR3A TaxID=2663838 RepID=UPI0016056673|nr:VCBS domain-containing protein [Bradyrhizobium sp. CIR3A]MBB4263001.1 VCBS repeat-containing protein [Bradyrhizobium sp. CIR3A]